MFAHHLPSRGKKSTVFYGTHSVNLLVIRIDKYGNYCSSIPCSSCIKFMKSIEGINIKKIYYFDTQGKFICKKLKDMENNHVSCGFRTLKV